jgi:sulfur-carrier protein
VAFRVIDEQGQVRPHMNIFLGEQSVRDLLTPVFAGAEIYIVGALSGG